VGRKNCGPHIHQSPDTCPGGNPQQVEIEFLRLDSQNISGAKNVRLADGLRGFWRESIAEATVFDYIANQEEHHRNVAFKDEFVAFLKKHEIEYDEKYLWE